MCKIFCTFTAEMKRIKDIYTHYMHYFCSLPVPTRNPQQELTPWELL